MPGWPPPGVQRPHERGQLDVAALWKAELLCELPELEEQNPKPTICVQVAAWPFRLKPGMGEVSRQGGAGDGGGVGGAGTCGGVGGAGGALGGTPRHFCVASASVAPTATTAVSCPTEHALTARSPVGST
jgi:hypothetical protein